MLNQYPIILVFFGVFNCIFFSLLLWQYPTGNKSANQYIAVIFLVLAIGWTHNLLPSEFPELRYWFFFTVIPTVLLIGPLVYFTHYNLSHPKPLSWRKRIVHLVPFGCVFMANVVWKLLNAPPYGLNAKSYFITIVSYQLHALVYIVACWFSLRRFAAQLNRFLSNESNSNFRLLTNFFWLCVGLWLCWLVPIFTQWVYKAQFHIVVSTLLVYIIFYNVIRQTSSFSSLSNQSDETIREVLDEEEKEDKIIEKAIDPRIELFKEELLTHMKKEKPYLDPELSLPKLAEQMDVTVHYLSQAINTSLNENFFQFINRYRIEESKKLLSQPDKQHYNILQIAYEAGFNSKTTFNTTFKKMVGVSPSEYQKQNLLVH
jgi:AraC-like DNA-binding protein